jgi:hypothetical protein
VAPTNLVFWPTEARWLQELAISGPRRRGGSKESRFWGTGGEGTELAGRRVDARSVFSIASTNGAQRDAFWGVSRGGVGAVTAQLLSEALPTRPCLLSPCTSACVNAAMDEQERMREELLALLCAEGVQAELKPYGALEAVRNERSFRVSCSWYERATRGLMLGMNPGNARSALRAAMREPYEGPEYFVTLRDGDAAHGTGRTREVREVISCALAWLAGANEAQVRDSAPFINATLRAAEALAARLPKALSRTIGADPSFEVWADADGRACCFVGTTCRFYLGQASVAYVPDIVDVAQAAHAWLIERVRISALPSRVEGALLEPHVEFVEDDPARWHWLNLLDRVRHERDALAPMRGLVEALSHGAVATRFYSFSSVATLCFSASSHYPWVTDDLPTVATDGHGHFRVGETLCDETQAIALVEARLSAATLTPFFGAEPHFVQAKLNRLLRGSGSALRAELLRPNAWFRLNVVSPDPTRSCEVWRDRVFLEADGVKRTVMCADDATLLSVVRRFCEFGEAMASLP